MSSKFATVMVQFVPASFVIGAGMELFMLNTVSADFQLSKASTCILYAVSCDTFDSQLAGRW